MSRGYQIFGRKHKTMRYTTGTMRGLESTAISGIKVGYGTKKPGHAYKRYRGLQQVNGGSQLGSYSGVFER